MIFEKIKKLFKNSRMDELEIHFIDEKRFKLLSFRSENAHVYGEFDESCKTFMLDDDGGLPNELFVFLSERFKIPREELAIHVFEN